MAQFISKDGYLDTAAFTALAREIDKYAAREGMKQTDIYFVAKAVPKYDKDKAKAGGELFERKRAQLVKVKKRMPPAGSRLKMVIVLRLYKELEDTDFDRDVQAALKAIAAHNKLAEKTIERIKKAAVKKREVAGKEFDKNLSAVEKLLLDAGLKSKDLAIGQSAMGKSMVVRLPNGGYVSIGKADADKFAKAKEPKAEGTGGGFGRKPKAEAEKPARRTRGEKPARAERKTRDAAPARGSREDKPKRTRAAAEPVRTRRAAEPVRTRRAAKEEAPVRKSRR